MKKITINGKDYELSEPDQFGLVYVNGKSVPDFLAELNDEDTVWLAKHGMSVIRKDPDYFDDIAERAEIPYDIKKEMDRFKP